MTDEQIIEAFQLNPEVPIIRDMNTAWALINKMTDGKRIYRFKIGDKYACKIYETDRGPFITGAGNSDLECFWQAIYSYVYRFQKNKIIKEVLIVAGTEMGVTV